MDIPVEGIISSKAEARAEAEAFFRKEAKKHSKIIDAYFQAFYEDVVHRALMLKTNGKALDLFTPFGFCAFHLEKKGFNVEGVQHFKEGVEIANGFAKDKKSGITFQESGSTKLPFEDNTFDLVVSKFAVHHLDEPLTTFREVQRILKPDGVFILSDIRQDAPWLYKKFGTLYFNSISPTFFQELKNSFLASYTFPEIKSVVEASNLSGAHLDANVHSYFIKRVLA